MLQEFDNSLIKPVYAKIKTMILNNEIETGQKIVQEKLAKQLGVSRTPVVKALHLLEKELLVTNVPRRGMFVREISMQDVVDAFEMRCAIESFATRVATLRAVSGEVEELRAIFAPFLGQGYINEEAYQKADLAFHSKIIEISRNAYFISYHATNHAQTISYNRGLVQQPHETLDEHMQMVDAMAAKNEKLAEDLMKQHLNKSIERLKEMLD